LFVNGFLDFVSLDILKREMMLYFIVELEAYFLSSVADGARLESHEYAFRSARVSLVFARMRYFQVKRVAVASSA